MLLKCYKIDNVTRSTVDSLGEIYIEVLNILKRNNLGDLFMSKCAEDNTSYTGPMLMKLDYKFILIETVTYGVDQEKFPRIVREEISPFLSDISYNIDLSSLEKYKI